MNQEVDVEVKILTFNPVGDDRGVAAYSRTEAEKEMGELLSDGWEITTMSGDKNLVIVLLERYPDMGFFLMGDDDDFDDDDFDDDDDDDEEDFDDDKK